MIVGKGSIAKLLNDRDDFIFFARGVSNSQQVYEHQIIKESLLLGQAMGNASVTKSMFVYFSSISVFTHHTDYTRHKKTIEKIIKGTADNFTILRLGNIWECTNPNTFINAIRTKKAKGEPIEIRDEYRYMISKDQLNFVTDNLPTTGKHEISIFGELVTVKDALKRMGV